MAIDFSTLKKASDDTPPRILIYGREKIGKTTLASGAPEAVFLLTEDGVGLNQIASTPVARSYDEFVEYLSGLASQDHSFKTLVIDSITGLERLIFAKVCDDAGAPSIEEALGGYGKGYVRAVELWQTLLGMIDYVRLQKGMMVILIGHADITRFSPPESEPYDRYGIRMNKNAIGAIQKWVDAIFFVKYQVSLTQDKTAARKRAVGGDERYVHTTEEPSFFGGNRYKLPGVIGPITEGGPELWVELVAKVPFLNRVYGQTIAKTAVEDQAEGESQAA